MKKVNYVTVLLSIVVLFQSCLGKEELYQCPTNVKAHLSFEMDGADITPDDYTSGAVLIIEETDSTASTLVDMNLVNNGTAYAVQIMMDTISATGVVYTGADVKSAEMSIGNDIMDVVISKIQFTNLEESVPSNYYNLFYYGLGKGSFEGKILKPGAVDSTTVTGIFCYDDTPIEK